MSTSISVNLMDATKSEATKIALEQYHAIPRVGETVRHRKKAYSVERVEWEPWPELPKVFIRPW
jgi:hypothetical protein